MPAAEENVALFAVTKQQVIGQVLNQTVRSAEFSDLYRKLRSAGLRPIVVKGPALQPTVSAEGSPHQRGRRPLHFRRGVYGLP